MDINARLGCFQLPGTGSKQTCQQCRLRKVRCDGNLSGCRTCRRLKFRCSLHSSIPTAGFAPAQSTPGQGDSDPSQRCRVWRACTGCREQKIRCSGQSPRCTHCERRDIVCTYSTTGKRRLRQSVDEGNDLEIARTVTPDDVDGQGSNEEETFEPASIFPSLPKDISQHVATFFARLYPLPSYSFLHPATIKKRCVDGTLEEPLGLAICALVALDTEPGGHDATCSLQWIQVAEQIIWEQLECLSIYRLQALLLIIRYRMETGRFQRAFMLVAMAARFAAAMRLNHEHPELNELAREVRRRVVWSLKLVERYFSIGLSEFEICPYETVYLELPCREDEFNIWKHQRGAASHELSELGVYKLCIQLESIRRDIMKLSRSIALCEDSFPLLPKLIHDFERELATIGDQIPDGPSFTSSAMARLVENPWLPRYMLLYLSWHQCHCDLYRLFLEGYEEAAPSIVLHDLDLTYMASTEQLCLQHAISIIRIVTNLNEHSTKSCLLEFDAAICVYHAIRLVFFISSRGRGTDLPTTEFAISRATLCLAALKRFFLSSVLVKPIIEEIERWTQTFSSRGWHLAKPRSSGSAIGRNPAERLSAVAKARQRLAIHSLLLQVECTDDDDDDDESFSALATDGARQCQQTASKARSLHDPIEKTYTSPLTRPSEFDLSNDILTQSSVVSPNYSHDSPILLDQTSLGLTGAWGSYPAELSNDHTFPLFPWWSTQE